MSDSKPVAASSGPLAAVPAVDPDADAPMTDKQAVILRALAEKAGEEFDGGLTRAQADERIAYLEGRS